ncbi:hypothetical protein ABFA07_010622 [Porites harrisoni]
MALADHFQLFSLKRKYSLMTTLAVVSSFLQIQAFTWNKAPSDPVYGILGENVTLRWSFKTDASHKLHYFTLLKYGMADMIMYSDVTDKVVVYEPYVGSVVLARNATPSFTLINLKSGDAAKYCCKVNTLNAIGGSQGNTHFNCTHLKLLARPSITSAISSNRTLNETDDVTLSCTASGKPPPNVTWTKADDVGNVLSWSSSLELKNITRKQKGLYRCTADNGLGKAESSVRIVVQFAPSIKLSTTRYNFTEGTNMTLLCESNGFPAPTVTWSKIGGVSDFSYPSSQRLIIRNLNRTEAGTYRCTASNGIGKPALHVMHVSVFYPASIVRGPLSQTVNETTDLHLFCNATGNPQPRIKWFRIRGLIRLGLPSFDGILIVRNISKSHSGIYKCIAINGIGYEADATSTVTVNYKPRTTLLTPNATKVKAIEGHPVTFYCKADGVPPPILELHFNGVLLGYFINGEYVMEKINATDQGKYECVARNILGIRRITTFYVNVILPPLLDFVTKNATVNETDSLELFCNATGKPRPNITWTFLGGADEEYSRKGETLTISDVKRNQAGFYQCTASNNVNSTQAVNVLVTVNYKPEIKDRGEITMDNIMSWIGRETKITCKVEGVPLPEIIWTRDGRVASLKRLHLRVSTLTFTPQRESDFGAYLCKARNFLGVARKVISVEMLAKPEAPIILEVLAGVNDLVIRWNASITHPAGPVLDYLVQVKEEDDPLRLKYCSRIEEIASSFTCVLDNLKSGTVYFVRVAARNIVGYSDFTKEEIRTKDVDDDEDKEMGALKQHKGKSTYVVDAIIGGVIGLSSLVVIIVAIVIDRRPCHKGSKKSNIDKSFKDGHDNEGFAENPKADELQEQQV